MSRPAVCPDREEYQWLAAGRLADAQEEALLRHLESCEACARKLHTQAEPDTLVDLIRRQQAQGDRAADGAIGRLVESLSKLRPGETPGGAGQATPPGAAEGLPLVVACPSCGKGLRVKGELVGEKVRCPGCKQALRVPETAADVKERARPAAGAGNTPPGQGGRSDFSTVFEEKAPGGGADSTWDPPSAAGDRARELYEFLAAPQAPDELGRLGPYRVLQVLGAGGMGVVFGAEDPHLARLVALKAMLPALAASGSARQRFLREARAAASIKHDHIVTIYQVGEDRGVPFLAMELLEGEPLDARLRREGKLPAAEVVQLGREVALGLAAAHQGGLIHRDVKPANLWLEARAQPAAGWRVKILDFGLARASGEQTEITHQGTVMGTPAYMAPEQAQGVEVTPRSDLFSLGCVLYRAATGEMPFKGNSVISTLLAAATETPTPPHELNPTLPPALSQLILRLLAKDPRERFASAQAVAEALGQVPPEPLPRPAGHGDRGKRRSGRWRRAVAVAALAALLPLGYVLSGMVVRVTSEKGTLVIETDDPGAEVKVTEKGGATLTYGPDRREIRLRPGEYGIELVKGKDGLTVSSPQFTITRGGKKTIEVRWEKKGAAPGDGDRKQAATPPPVLPGVKAREPLSLLKGHRDIVWGVSFSPDGQRLVSGGKDGTLRLWDAATGQEIRTLASAPETWRTVAWSPDGKLIAAGGNSEVSLWDAETGARAGRLTGHASQIRGLAFRADGRTLATSSCDHQVKLWNVADRTLLKTLSGHKGYASALAMSRSGKWLASGSWDGTLKLWDAQAGKLKFNFPNQPGVAQGMSLSPDERLFASGSSSGHVRIWDVGTGRMKLELKCPRPPGRVWGVAFNPEGSQLAVGADRLLGLWDPATGDLVRELEPMHRSGVLSLAWSPDGRRLATGSGDVDNQQDGAVGLWTIAH